jgi:hypothetical protein
MAPDIDLVILSRDESALASDVQSGIAAQTDARLTIHRVTGRARPEDANRWQTIARARNEGKSKGQSDWVMYLDDDVALAPGCVRRLWDELQRRPAFGALAADYLGESRADAPARHVGMGATLFRRAALAEIGFRWKTGRCECQCCCDDLRRIGFGIDYVPAAGARHLDTHKSHRDPSDSPPHPPRTAPAIPGRVLAAFDRAHYGRFVRQFLPSLRASGNAEVVMAVGYGLYSRQQRELARRSDVELLPLASNSVCPARRRLYDFQTVLSKLPAETPVAYWDAGDVIFQSPLAQLWNLVRARPDRLHVAQESVPFLKSSAMLDWTRSIEGEQERRRAFELLSSRPVLNSGFAAATAGVLTTFCQAAHCLRNSEDMRGSTDWDQLAVNLYCRTTADTWCLIEESWNYCLFYRAGGEVVVDSRGYLRTRTGAPIHVAHGNGQTFVGLPGFWRTRKRVPTIIA